MSDSDEKIDIALLLGDLKSDVFEYKMSYAKRLGMIALAVGPERTRNELLATITDYFDVEDEILCIIAEELGGIVPFIGGQEYYKYVLVPLEKLCAVEEVLVAEKAVASVIPMIQTANPSDTNLEGLFVAMINRLGQCEWFTAKVSACALIVPLIKTYPQRKQELLEIFNTHSLDQTPMIRQAAAKNLALLVPLLETPFLIQFATPLLKKLVEDELDFVRFSTIGACVALFATLSNEDAAVNITALFKTLASDKAWRTRQKVAEAMKEFVASAKSDTLRNEFINATIKFLKDDELEVRITCTSVLPGLAQAVLTPPSSGGASSSSAGASSSSSSASDAYFFKEIVPLLKALSTDDVQRVREALSGALPQLAPLFGKTRTIVELVPLVKEILLNKDEATEVKLALLSRIETVLAVVDSHTISDLLRLCFEPLAYAHPWRIRHALLLSIPTLCRHVSTEYFNTSLLKTCLLFLGDQVAAVRDAACTNMKELTALYKEQWAKTVLIPNITKLTTEKNYLYRITALECLASLSPLFSTEDVEATLFPVASVLARDSVPNVRFNLAKTLLAFSARFSAEGAKTKLRPLLEHLAQDKDKEVKYFAQQGLASLV